MVIPAGFWWGTGNSSTQCEGAAEAGTWLGWEQAGHAPPSDDGNGFETRHAEDFALLDGIGLGHFRLSLEWARLEPEQDRHDDAEIERYRALLSAGREAGLHMWVTAHHFTLPTWFSQMGGFADTRAREYHWRRHIEFLAETFGDLVFGWKPINEPHAFAMCGWLLAVHPPGHADLGEALVMLAATHRANHVAWQVLRGGGRPVATIQNLSPSFATVGDEASRTVATTMDALSFDMWIDMIRDGVLRTPQIPGVTSVEPIVDSDFVDAFDVIGFSYYNATGVEIGRDPAGRAELVQGPWPPDAAVTAMGYAPWSDGLGVVIDRLHAALPHKPLLVSEYGIGTDDDFERCRYIDAGVAIARDALDRGVDLRGFFHWTGVDNYEWEHGFDVRFGLFDLDRAPRPSAGVIARHTRTAG